MKIRWPELPCTGYSRQIRAGQSFREWILWPGATFFSGPSYLEELPLTGSACRGTEGFEEFAGDF